uniref:Uncharacterized protein n=1 Tax=Pseudictyota dubia TaxID=2749911 RepID=A0A7R9WJT4_9STRA|mmetsp:Transcript_8470/g.15493  ORF Transcript_8470/g.15493 Transcript_8470/m.15493 type:complete len:110 (+) Transcript_8470:90-419(+)
MGLWWKATVAERCSIGLSVVACIAASEGRNQGRGGPFADMVQPHVLEGDASVLWRACGIRCSVLDIRLTPSLLGSTKMVQEQAGHKPSCSHGLVSFAVVFPAAAHCLYT